MTIKPFATSRKRTSFLFGLGSLFVWILLAASAAAEPLRLGLPPYANPSSVYASFAPLALYLGNLLEAQILIDIPSSYAAQIQRVCDGEVDLAILGPSPYIEAQQKSNALELLARLVFRDNVIEQVVLITSPESPITDIASLRGRSFVFGDRMSFGSHYLPRWLLEEHDIQMNDLRSHAFLGNQDNVLLSVVHRDFDAGGVRLDILQKFAGRPLRIFHGPVPIPPHVVVCGIGLDQAIRKRIRTALLELRDEGVLRAISPDMRGFLPVDDEQFDFARAIMRSLQKGRTP